MFKFTLLFVAYLSAQNLILPKGALKDTQSPVQNTPSIQPVPQVNYYDTLLSPIESLFMKITGKKELKQVGYRHFRVYGGRYINSQNLSPAYTLGPGDEITVYISGSIENTFTSVIDKRGTIFIPGLGPVKISGMSIDKAEKFLNKVASEKWSNVKIFISPGRIRGIKVFLTGETPNPGAYILKSKSTVLDLLFLARGVLKTGTLRNIEIIHQNGSKVLIDLYPFIFGGTPENAELMDGDVVVIPPIKNVIAIEGSLYKPGIYEIKPTTTLRELTKWSGIMPFNQKRAIIKRLEGDSIHIFDVPRDRWHSFKLKNGDYITIPISRYIKSGYIYVEGNIKKPGYYTFKPGLILKEAIQRAGGFLYSPYNEILIVRQKALHTTSIEVTLKDMDTFRLQDRDSIFLFREDILTQKEPVSINGYVEHPGIFKWHDKLSLKSLILLAKPRPDASLNHVIVFKKREKKSKVIREDLLDSIFLEPGDIVFVPPDTFKTSYIRVYVGGEVRFPGMYTIPKGSSVNYILNLSGGATQNAYTDGMYIKRKTDRQTTYERLSEFNLYILDSSARYMPDSLFSLLKQRILHVLPATYNTQLQNGDSIFIPQNTSFVYVAGATVQPHYVPYTHGLKLIDILHREPLLRMADKKHAFAIGVNGKIHKGRLYPGDIVYIPFKTEKPTPTLKNLSYISGIVYQIVTTLFIIYQIKK